MSSETSDWINLLHHSLLLEDEKKHTTSTRKQAFRTSIFLLLMMMMMMSMPHKMQRWTRCYLLSVILLLPFSSAWVAPAVFHSSCPLHRKTQQQLIPQYLGSISRLYATSPKTASGSNKKKQSRASTEVVLDQDDDLPAGIEGAQFFGGNKQKEEFFDPVAEADAEQMIAGTVKTTYSRFDDRTAFTDETVAAIASSLQNQFNQVLYEETNNSNSEKEGYIYASNNLSWKTPFPVQSTSTTPLEELEAALGFYRRLDLAITSGETVNNNNGETQYRIRWEISLAWPTFWEPRILLTGTSLLTLPDKTNVITSQVDELDGTSSTDGLFSAIFKQWVPRFWDFYHIGMTPSAELSPRKMIFKSLPLFQQYNHYELPPRLYLQPRQLDLGTRVDANAATVPNHAFSCVIRTMGPTKQRYIPCGPTQVQIIPTAKQKNLQLQWNIPIAVECMTNAELAIPGPDDEASPASEPSCEYVFQPRRSVATLRYGGSPQDLAIADVRKRLYELVTKDGLKPKLDDNGRPIFFFWQNAVKACYTDEGLGMVVYEWRPRFVQSNEVGIELEIDNTTN